MELNEKINFLDVTISRTNNVISTNWYQKSIASDRVLLFTSNHTVQQKRNMVYNLVDRAFLLSEKQYYDDNQRIITQLLLNNKCPIEFIKIHMRNRLNKILDVDKNKKDSEYKKILKLFAKHNIRTVPILNKS